MKDLSKIPDYQIVATAACNGDLETLEYFKSKDYKFNYGDLRYALHNNHIHVIKFFIDFMKNNPEEKSSFMLSEFWHDATISNNIDQVKYLIDEGFPVDSTAYTYPIENCNKQMLDLLYKNKFPLTTNEFNSAIEKSDWSILYWLKDHNCPWDETTCVWAIKNRKLATLMWLHYNGCPWDNDVLIFSKSWGNHEICQWLEFNYKN